MMEQPQKEHQWLQKLVGEWTFEMECPDPEGGPPLKCRGTDSVRSMNGMWVIAEGQSEILGGAKGSTMVTLGFDAKKGRYVGSWVGSMMSAMWVYEGEVSADGRKLTLNCEGVSMCDPAKHSSYRDEIEFLNDNYRTLSSWMQDENGNWQHFMTAHYHRV